jgi:hypothetical protein
VRRRSLALTLVLFASFWLVPAGGVASAPPRRPASPPSLAIELAAAATAAEDFLRPAVPLLARDRIGRYEPMGTGVALDLLAGRNPCAELRDGIPYVDYRRCPVEDVPPVLTVNPGTVALYGLRFWDLGGRRRALALLAARWLVNHQSRDGSWRVPFPVPGEGLASGWDSAMYQGAAISLLLRAYAATSQRSFLDAARAALAPFYAPYGRGGVVAETPYGPFPEEYPGPTADTVLNGGLTALIGLREYSLFTGEPLPILNRFLATLHRLLPALTLPGWAAYQLSPPEPAPPFYMGVETAQILLLGEELHDPVLLRYGSLWRSDFLGPDRLAAARARQSAGIVP